MKLDRRILGHLADDGKAEVVASFVRLESGGHDRSDGEDRAALSRLENGVAVNPTINTLARYAQALGKRVEVRGVDAADPLLRQPAKQKPTARKSVK